MLDFALLGCGGSMPIPERNLTALLIQYKGKKILIDCGEGTQVSMKQLAWGFKSIDIICITHAHADHVVGLPGLLATIRNSERTEPLTIIGPKGIKRVVEGLCVIVPYLTYELNIIEQPQEEILFNENVTIRSIELDHTTPCLGYQLHIKRSPRFDVEKALSHNVPKVLWSRLQKKDEINYEGKTYTSDLVLGKDRKGIKLSYITDTRPFNQLEQFVHESDVLIAEGMYGDPDDHEKAIKNKHMTFTEAATLAKQADVQSLILTHYSPSMLQPEQYLHHATEIFEQTQLGTDRLIKQLIFQNKK